MSKLEDLYNEQYICPGPTNISFKERYIGREDELTPGVGKMVSYSMCMNYPDCGCRRFYNQADQIDEAREEEHEST